MSSGAQMQFGARKSEGASVPSNDPMRKARAYFRSSPPVALFTALTIFADRASIS